MPENRIENIETLITSMRDGLQPEFLFFWGHRPEPGGRVGKQCLSQWWEGSPFEVEGALYATAEHYMMAEKARLFGDKEMRQKILAAPGSKEAKALGQDVRGYVDTVWEEHRFEIVTRGNAAKFGQHAALKSFLLGTGERLLVEASPFDRVWGIGLAADDAAAARPEGWKGLNLLGFALMRVRERLRRG